MNRIAGRAKILLLLILLLLGGLGFFIYEYVSQSADWVLFPGSPHVYSGNDVEGCTVVDRGNVLLLNTTDGRMYSTSMPLRKATVHWLGDKSGNISASALSHYTAQMAGYSLWNGVYTYGQDNSVVNLTLSAKLQTVALEAMGEYKGTVAVYNYKTGEILCAVTTPSFDPENVPDFSLDTTGAYEGVYFNRFIQSSFTPGSIFKIVTLAAALETIPDIEKQEFVCTGEYAIGEDKITCEDPHWEQNLQSAFCNSCNCAFAQIVQQLGADVLERYVHQFGIVEPIQFDGITTAAGNFDLTDASDVNIAWSGIGQYKDLINPCAYLNFIGSIAAGGRGVQSYLVDSVSVGGTQTYHAKTETTSRIVSADTADIITEYMRLNVVDKYGVENFPGLTVCAKTGTGEVGGDKKSNAMFTGFVLDQQCPLAFIICVEDAGYGRTICMPIASKVLQACKEVLSVS